MVNANMFADPFGDGSNPLGVSYGAIYIATAIAAVVGTILAGLRKKIKEGSYVIAALLSRCLF